MSMSKSIAIYGIKNCNTMKKALNWLDENNVTYEFHDYKKTGADDAVLKAAFAAHGWERVINRQGMSWRKLPDHVKAGMDSAGAMRAAQDNPSLIKRPLIVAGVDIILGFDEQHYAQKFG